MKAEYSRSVWGLDVGKMKWACVKLWMDEEDEIKDISTEPIAYLPQPELTPDCLLAIADAPIGLRDDCEAQKSKKGKVVGRRPSSASCGEG